MFLTALMWALLGLLAKYDTNPTLNVKLGRVPMAKYITNPMAWEYGKLIVGPLWTFRLALGVTKQAVGQQFVISNSFESFFTYVSSLN